ncbi:MAG: DNA polymerase IV [Candidatus Bipolaricaulota bacterium]
MPLSEGRWIGHLDMDAFFASIEQLDEPAYRGRPVVVGGLGPRGVVSTASYEARAFGVHSAMPMAVAQKRCPHAVFLPGRFSRYHEISLQVRQILEQATSALEMASLDEAFLDLTVHGASARDIAARLKHDVCAVTGLSCSVGVAPNRFLAKMASERSKPDGFLVIEPERVREVLDPLPVGEIWGVGEATERRLQGLGILRIVDLRTSPLELLVREFGSLGQRLQELSRGEDETPVAAPAESLSLSREVTYDVDLVSAEDIEAEVRRLARAVAAELRHSAMLCRMVRIKFRYPDYHTVTRQARLPAATDSAARIEEAVVHLLQQSALLDDRGVRLLGVGVARLCGVEQRQLELPRVSEGDRRPPEERGQ